MLDATAIRSKEPNAESATYTIPITFEDFRIAQRLYRRYRPVARLQMVVNISFAFVCSCGMLILGFSYYQHGNEGAAFGWWCASAVLAVYGCVRWPLLMRRLYRQVFPKAYAGTALQLRWTDDQLIYTAPGLSEVRYHWKLIKGVAEDENTVLLMLSKTAFIMVTRKAMPGRAMLDLIAHATTKEIA